MKKPSNPVKPGTSGGKPPQPVRGPVKPGRGNEGLSPPGSGGGRPNGHGPIPPGTNPNRVDGNGIPTSWYQDKPLPNRPGSGSAAGYVPTERGNGARNGARPNQGLGNPNQLAFNPPKSLAPSVPTGTAGATNGPKPRPEGAIGDGRSLAEILGGSSAGGNSSPGGRPLPGVKPGSSGGKPPQKPVKPGSSGGKPPQKPVKPPPIGKPKSSEWGDIVQAYFPKVGANYYRDGGLVRGGGAATKGRGRGKIV